MQRRTSPRATEQTSLLDPPERPAWEALPADVRREVLTLLAELLRRHAGRGGGTNRE